MKLTRIFRELKLQDNVEFMGEKFLVSTVQIAYPAPYGWYETMLFTYRKDGSVDWSEKYCMRYVSKKEAIKGHYALLDTLKNNYKTNRQYWRAKHGRGK